MSLPASAKLRVMLTISAGFTQEMAADVVAATPEAEFVLAEDLAVAYADRPQGIGHGQTISQPYMVAVMTELLDLGAADRVLEIGTGSGYQAAVLAEVAGHVYSLELIAALADGARRRLAGLGYDNVTVRHADGYAGWPEEAPFDAVMVTAAPKKIPPILIEQLKPGGRLVVPTGRPHGPQMLQAGTKGEDGRLEARRVLPVAFVPMVEG